MSKPQTLKHCIGELKKAAAKPGAEFTINAADIAAVVKADGDLRGMPKPADVLWSAHYRAAAIQAVQKRLAALDEELKAARKAPAESFEPAQEAAATDKESLTVAQQEPEDKPPEQQTETEFGAVLQAIAIAEAELELKKAKAGDYSKLRFKSKTAAVRAAESNLKDAKESRPEQFAGDHLGAINKAIGQGRMPSAENIARYDIPAEQLQFAQSRAKPAGGVNDSQGGVNAPDQDPETSAQRRLKAEVADARRAQSEAAATHKDLGEPAEPVTPAVVAEAIKTGVQATERKPSAMKADLLAQIDAAMAEAPDKAGFDSWVAKHGRANAEAFWLKTVREAPTGKAKFRVPGDGMFTVLNDMHHLMTFRAKVESSHGFKARTPKPQQERTGTSGAYFGVQEGSSSAESAIRNMIDDGDPQAAVDYAAARGLNIADVLKGDKVRLPKIAGLTPTTDEGPVGEFEAEVTAPAEPAPTPPAAAPEPGAPAAQSAAPAPAAETSSAFASKTLSELQRNAGTQGVWLGRLVHKDGSAADLKALPWPNRNMGDYGVEWHFNGKREHGVPFADITSGWTAQRIIDRLLDYLNADGTEYTVDQVGEKHARLTGQRSTIAQRRADAEMNAMRKWRGDTEARPWDDVDLASKRRYDEIAGKRYKTAIDETMMGILTRRAEARPDKWKPGDGVGYKPTRDQINRGFQVVSVNEADKTVTISQVADTGLTRTGGNNDRMGAQTIDVGDLVRDRKYDRPAPAAESATPSAAEKATIPELESFGLLREFNGRWQYKPRIGGSWLTANRKEDAVERAATALANTPEAERLTTAQRGEKADEERMAVQDRNLGRLTIPELEARLAGLGGTIASLQRAGEREFNGNGGRRTSAATSNEGARLTGQEKLDLTAYIEWRKARDGAAETAAPVKTGVPVTLFYSRNTESAKGMAPAGMDMGQDIEPAGEYMNVELKTELKPPTDKWEAGRITFKSPLVLPHKSTDSKGWKRDLSQQFGGKTGKALTAAIKAAGHDGIITWDAVGLSETVNLAGEKAGPMDATMPPVARFSRAPSPSLAAVEAAWDARGIESAMREKNGIITLSKIIVPKGQREKGLGTAAMQELLAYADQTGQQIALTPSGDFGGNKARLSSFYRGLGFRTYKGFAVREALIRDPSAVFSRAPKTDSAEFKRWFGDSKVVDAQGKPLVVYHGTDKDFSAFDLTKMGDGAGHTTSFAGFFFSADATVAGDFPAVKWEGWPLKRAALPGQNLMPVYLSITNPLTMTAKEFQQKWVRNMASGLELRAEAIDAGHDGIRITGDAALAESMGGEEYGADAWVAFRPEQIKSATGNNGQYDPENPDIRYSRAQGQGVSMRDAEALKTRIRAVLPNAPEIRLVESIDEVPPRLQDEIREEGAEDDLEAVYYEGVVYGFPGHWASLERGEFVMGHHEIRHHGMRALLMDKDGGLKALDAKLLDLHRSNPALQAATQAIKDAGRAKQNETVKAIEEALADMPAEQVAALSGWDKFIAAVRDWLRMVSRKLRAAGLTSAAKAIEPSAWTDKDVAAFVLRAERVSGKGAGGAVFSRRYDPMVNSTGNDYPSPAKNTKAEIDAAHYARARIQANDGVASPDDLAAMLRVPGYSQRARTAIARNVDAATRLRAALAAIDPGSYSRGQVNQQGAIDISAKTLARYTPEKIDALTALADEFDAPIVVRGHFGDMGESLFQAKRMQADGFVAYTGITEPSERKAEGMIQYIRPGGGIGRNTPMFSRPTQRTAMGDMAGKLSAIPQAAQDVARAADVHPSNRRAGDAMFSRTSDLGQALSGAMNHAKDVSLIAGYKVGDLMQGAGKLHWWHKGPGTMYNLAQRSPPFRRVYEAVHAFITDATFYAAEAANLAPTILPRLEGFGDVLPDMRRFGWNVGKSPLSVADTKAYSAALFDGTLKYGRDANGKLRSIAVLKETLSALPVEEKAQRLLRYRRVHPNVLRMWQGLQQEQYDAIIEGKFEREFLRPGVVFTDAELRAKFNMTAPQIRLYREARKAIDKSVSNLAVSGMLQYAGKDADGMHEAVMAMGDHNKAATKLSDYFTELADKEPDRAEIHKATADKMLEVAGETDKLQKEGYAPLSRFGSYTLEATTKDGERYFAMFDTDAERNKAKRMLAADGATDIRAGTMSQEEHKLLNGVSPETAALFGEILGLDEQGSEAKDIAYQAYLKKAVANRSAMKHMIHRKGIAGFNDDAGRVLAAFLYSNGRKTSSNLHTSEVGFAIEAVPKEQGELKDAAKKLQDYVRDPQEGGQAIRGLMFAQYLGGSVASALVNATQPFTMTFPYLSQYGGVKGAAAQLKAAFVDAAKTGATGDKALDAALKQAEEEGTVSPQEVHYLQAQASGQAHLAAGDGTLGSEAAARTHNAMTRVGLAWGQVFGIAEQYNRRITFIAAYRLAVEQKMADPAGFAKNAVDVTQGVYTRANRPRWARGTVGAIAMTFKQYGINYVEMLHRMAFTGGPDGKGTPEGRRAALLALAVLFLMAGADGLPFIGDAEEIVDAGLQRLGYNFTVKQKKREMLTNALSEGWAGFIMNGLSGIPGSPIDFSGRTSMGNMVPGLGLLMKKKDYTRDLQELAGPAGDLVKRGFEAAGQVASGNPLDALKTISPVAVRNAVQGADMASTGLYRDTKGAKVVESNMGEALMKGIGFQPKAVKDIGAAGYEVQRQKQNYIDTKAEIHAKWARGRFENDPAMIQEARDDMASWNRKNPDQKMVPNVQAIRKREAEMRKTKAQRLADTAPKAIRQQVRDRLAEVES